jgi:hypothetical protein
MKMFNRSLVVVNNRAETLANYWLYKPKLFSIASSYYPKAARLRKKYFP